MRRRLHHNEVTTTQEAAALLLAAGKTIVDAANELNIGKRTIKQWLNTELFANRIRYLRQSITEKSVEKLSDISCSAVGTLHDLMKNSKSASVRIKSAKAILEIVNRTRLAALEDKISQSRLEATKILGDSSQVTTHDIVERLMEVINTPKDDLLPPNIMEIFR